MNIIVAVVFCAKIVVDFGFESVIIDCLYSGTFLIEQLKKYDIFDIKINKLLGVLTQFREVPLLISQNTGVNNGRNSRNT